MIDKFSNWLDSLTPPIWIDLIRIGVGGFIIYKGYQFMTNFDVFTENIASVGWIFIAAHLAQVIIFVHLVCGSLLLLGAVTRWMSLLNLPILAGAVIFNYKKMLTGDNYMELPAALVILVLLLILAIAGSGKLSLEGRAKALEKKS